MFLKHSCEISTVSPFLYCILFSFTRNSCSYSCLWLMLMLLLMLVHLIPLQVRLCYHGSSNVRALLRFHVLLPRRVHEDSLTLRFSSIHFGYSTPDTNVAYERLIPTPAKAQTLIDPFLTSGIAYVHVIGSQTPWRASCTPIQLSILRSPFCLSIFEAAQQFSCITTEMRKRYGRVQMHLELFDHACSHLSLSCHGGAVVELTRMFLSPQNHETSANQQPKKQPLVNIGFCRTSFSFPIMDNIRHRKDAWSATPRQLASYPWLISELLFVCVEGAPRQVASGGELLKKSQHPTFTPSPLQSRKHPYPPIVTPLSPTQSPPLEIKPEVVETPGLLPSNQDNSRQDKMLPTLHHATPPTPA